MAVPPASSPAGTIPFVSTVCTAIMCRWRLLLTAYQVELADFHTKHFSGHSKDYFATTFLAEGVVGEEHDNLGYYADGVKRTITDEQIAMFRHTEIETLLRQKRKSDEAKADKAERASGPQCEIVESPESQDASLTDAQTSKMLPTPSALGQPSETKPSKEDKKKKKSHFKRNIKLDLRKRTWDQVDHGLETLDYEEDVARPEPKRNAGPQRRTISYDDV